jgi:hypothetical protein
VARISAGDPGRRNPVVAPSCVRCDQGADASHPPHLAREHLQEAVGALPAAGASSPRDRVPDVRPVGRPAFAGQDDAAASALWFQGGSDGLVAAEPVGEALEHGLGGSTDQLAVVGGDAVEGAVAQRDGAVGIVVGFVPAVGQQAGCPAEVVPDQPDRSRPALLQTGDGPGEVTEVGRQGGGRELAAALAEPGESNRSTAKPALASPRASRDMVWRSFEQVKQCTTSKLPCTHLTRRRARRLAVRS